MRSDIHVGCIRDATWSIDQMIQRHVSNNLGCGIDPRHFVSLFNVMFDLHDQYDQFSRLLALLVLLVLLVLPRTCGTG